MRISDMIAPAILAMFADEERTVNAPDAKSLKAFTMSELERPVNIALEPIRAAMQAVSGKPVKFEANDIRSIIVKHSGAPHETDENGSPFPIVRVPDGLVDSTGRGGSTFYASREEWERYEDVFEEGPSLEDAKRAVALLFDRAQARAGESVWGWLSIANTLGLKGSVENLLKDSEDDDAS